MSNLISFSANVNAAAVLSRVATTQKESGHWERTEQVKGSDFLYLKNSSNNTEMCVTGSLCGTKAVVYIMPRNAENELVVNLTTSAISRAIKELGRKLIPHRRMYK